MGAAHRSAAGLARPHQTASPPSARVGRHPEARARLPGVPRSQATARKFVYSVAPAKFAIHNEVAKPSPRAEVPELARRGILSPEAEGG